MPLYYNSDRTKRSDNLASLAEDTIEITSMSAFFSQVYISREMPAPDMMRSNFSSMAAFIFQQNHSLQKGHLQKNTPRSI